MRNNVLNISIGIPAFNEEKNIEKLLKAILTQSFSEKKYLLEIIVASDGSTDKTVSIVNSFNDERIKLIDGKERIGKNMRMNQIFTTFKGGVLITLDADIAFIDKHSLNFLTNPFVESKKIGLVAGNAQPLPAKTLAARAFNNYVKSLNYIKKRIKNGNNVFSVRGPLLSLSRELAKKIHLPKNVPDDKFIYLFCKQHNFNFVYRNDAKVFFKSAETLKDQITQGIRYNNDRKSLNHLFNTMLLENEYSVPLYLKVMAFIIQIIKDPFAYIAMKYIQLNVIFGFKTLSHDTWCITSSTKDLNI